MKRTETYAGACLVHWELLVLLGEEFQTVEEAFDLDDLHRSAVILTPC